MKANRLSLLEELTLEKEKVLKKMHQRQTQHILNLQVCRSCLPSVMHKNTVITQIFYHTSYKSFFILFSP